MSSTRIRSLFAVLVFLLSAQAVMAENYYVRPDGQDNNSGLQNSANGAWKTIQHAADNAAPGDTIFVQDGTYDEVVVVNSQGLSGFPIEFVGVGNVYVTAFDFPGSPQFSRAVFYYVTLDNFIFDGGLNDSEFGVSLRGAYYITIRNSEFRNFRGTITEYPGGTFRVTRLGLKFNGNAWTSSNYLTVEDTSFINNSAGVHGQMLQNSLFDNCLFSGNTYGFAVQYWGSRYNTFANSRFTGNDKAIYLAGVYWYWLKSHHNTVYRSIFDNNDVGVLIGDNYATSYGAVSYANTVVNSDFYASNGSGIVVNTNFSGVYGGTPEYYDAQGQTVTNNIFLGNAAFGLDNIVNQTIFPSYNLAFANGVAAGNNAQFDATNFSILADPLFIDAANGDFRLGANSPAIDAGNPDYNNDPEVLDGVVDIGAFERNANPSDIVTALTDEAAGIPESFLKNENNSLPLSKKLHVALMMVIKGDEEFDPAKADNYYHAAVQKLSQDILPKTDGCALTGAPDSNDWITDCSTQADFYEPIVSTIAMLEGM